LKLLFKNDNMYDFILDSLQDLYIEETQTYYGNILEFQNESPIFFGVPKHLSLIDSESDNLPYRLAIE